MTNFQMLRLYLLGVAYTSYTQISLLHGKLAYWFFFGLPSYQAEPNKDFSPKERLLC